ncbi:MAG: RNA polymerase sigma factor [bacterium]|nr:RNA polymerase sigma factor [bacterium]
MEMADEPLRLSLERALAGDAQDRNCFFKEFHLLVVRSAEAIARRYALEDMDRDEIIQLCLLKCLRMLNNNPEKLLEIQNWPSWLFRVLSNLAKDHYRKQVRLRHYEVLSTPFPGQDDPQSRQSIENIPAPDDLNESREDAEFREELFERIEQALDKVANPLQKEVFQLYQAGYTQKQIAASTGVKMTTLNNWINRLKTRIKEIVQEQCIQEGLL